MAYTHGHHESVLRSHTWRTAQNSAAYLLPNLAPGLSVLDVGCGPGTITADLALLVAPGEVVGIDASEEVVAQAAEVAGSGGLSNLRFEVGDLFALEYPDESFEVIHLHQVLQHLSDPVEALVSLRRVLAVGGGAGGEGLGLLGVHVGAVGPDAGPVAGAVSGRDGPERPRRMHRAPADGTRPGGRLR
ncbi:MAG TPA: class I SAM-dependent methyltransferase, partial [Pedococcus sp.]|nr:class I SAM-dependent methyltransferase [Pedococcus sp.]